MASFFILSAGTLWGIIGLFSHALSELGFSPVEITFLRNAVAAIGLGGYLLIFHREYWKIGIKDIWMFLGTGIISVVFFNIAYFITIELSTLSFAAILLYTAPFFVLMISAVLFREPLSKRKILVLLLAFGGCLFTTGIPSAIHHPEQLKAFSLSALLFGLGSGFCYALYSIFGKIALKKYRAETVTFYTFLMASLFLTPFCLQSMDPIQLFSKTAAVNVLGIGLISTLAPFCLYTIGLSRTSPGKAAVLAFAEPMVATLAGFVFLNQQLTLSEGIGIALIFLSLVLLNLPSSSSSQS